MSDLVERLRRKRVHHASEATDEDCIAAADEIERLQRELAEAKTDNDVLRNKGLEWLNAYKAESSASHEARRYAFFVGWEMCETANAEDTCADAFAFWSLMEDGRDEVEGRALRAKAEETQG